MTKQELVAKMQEKQAWVPGKRVKIDFGGVKARSCSTARRSRSPKRTATPTRRSGSAGTTGSSLQPASSTA